MSTRARHVATNEFARLKEQGFLTEDDVARITTISVGSVRSWLNKETFEVKSGYRKMVMNLLKEHIATLPWWDIEVLHVPERSGSYQMERPTAYAVYKLFGRDAKVEEKEDGSFDVYKLLKKRTGTVKTLYGRIKPVKSGAVVKPKHDER
jgi:hypothetical protein